MQQIREALNQLVGGFPSQATRTIQKLSSTRQNFFADLTNLITGDQTQQLQGKCLSGGVITLNTLALRFKSNSSIKQLLTLQEIYGCLLRVLHCEKLQLQIKKLISPALTQFLQTSYSAHKQVISMKNSLTSKNQHYSNQSIIVALDSISNTKSLSKPILIQCIIEIFQISVLEMSAYMSIVCHQFQNQRESMSASIRINRNNSMQNVELGVCFKRIKYFVGILHHIFVQVFKNINQPYEYEAITYLISNNNLADILIGLIEWRDRSKTTNNNMNIKYQFPWFNDIKIQSSSTATATKIQFYDINNIKQKCFLIISSILQKADPNYNLSHCENRLMRHMPTLCENVLNQIVRISSQFTEINQQFLVASLCDSELSFLAQCLRFKDLLYVFGHNVSQSELVKAVMEFLRIRDTDLSVVDQEYFCDFLEGFSGGNNYHEISRYAVSYFVHTCCQVFDSFPAYFFQMCMHTILQQIEQRLKTSENASNCYQHLYTKSNITEEIQVHSHIKIEIASCLLGLISLQDKLSRPDFRSVIVDFFLVLELKHFNQEEIAMLYFILGKNVGMFLEGDMIDAAARIVSNGINSTARNQKCSAQIFQFITQLYLNFLIRIPVEHIYSKKYLNLIENVLWNDFIEIFSSKSVQLQTQVELWRNLSFLEMLCEVVNVEKYTSYKLGDGTLKVSGKNVRYSQLRQKEQLGALLSRVQNPMKLTLKIENIGDCILTKKSLFIEAVLQKCCEKQQQIFKKSSKTQSIESQQTKILLLRLHQLILQCLQSINWINSLQSQQYTFDIQFKKVQLKTYIQYPTHMIKNIMTLVNDPQSGIEISVQEILNLVELLAAMVTQERMLNPNIKPSKSEIDEELFELLLPVNLEHPFGEPWLVCVCQFTHRINARYKLYELQKILTLISDTYTKHYQNQLKLNQINLFSLVLLNYQQPETWIKIHQNIRILFLKLIKIQSHANKIERKRNMLKLGFESESIYGITVIRMFHVYLFGYKMENIDELFAEIVGYYSWFVERYTVIEAAHLILSFRASYKYLSSQNLDKLLDIVILILNKLILNENYYGNESIQESRIRRLSYKIGCLAFDPYSQFRTLVTQMSNQLRVNIMEHPKFQTSLKNLLNVNTVKGQPRKLYSIKKIK